MDATTIAESRRGTSGWRYVALLVALLASLLVMPLVEGGVLERPARATIVSVILFAALGVLWPRRRLRILGVALIAPAFAAPWLALALDNDAIRTAGQSLAALLFLLATAVLAFDLARETRVTVHTVYAAMCGYVMIALVFAAAYATVELAAPGSLVVVSTREGVPVGAGDFQYFSLITLASVGFGDIVPAAGFARGLAGVEAVVGQFYMAVIVARLVSLFVTSPSPPAQS